MKSTRLLIGGDLVESGEQLEVVNPATGEPFVSIAKATERELDSAVAAAKAAQKEWAKTSFEERRALVNKIADTLAANIEELAQILTLEQGKPLAAATMEVQFSEAFCRYFADQELPVEVLSETDEQRVEIHRKPLGVVAGICPWNFPLLIAIYKIAPALMTGNSIIIKPAPTTPVATAAFGEKLVDVVPAGLVNVLVDSNELGPKITTHPDIAKVSFTGSTPTGKAIMASAASTLKRVTLELGGNDAAIVLPDVDPKAAAPGIFGAAFLNSGQVCIALKRLYVHESIYDEMCDEIAKLAAAAKVGNGMDEGVEYGPVQNKMQYEKVLSYIEDGKANGTVLTGGDPESYPGYIVPLTVVRDVTDGDKLVDEEPFGPVLPIIKYSSVDDAIERANSSAYGLGGSVWSSDSTAAQEVADQIDAGTVWVNQHCAFGPNIPFPPAKESGIGVEWGTEGMQEFTGMKVVNINKAYQQPVH